MSSIDRTKLAALLAKVREEKEATGINSNMPSFIEEAKPIPTAEIVKQNQTVGMAALERIRAKLNESKKQEALKSHAADVRKVVEIMTRPYSASGIMSGIDNLRPDTAIIDDLIIEEIEPDCEDCGMDAICLTCGKELEPKATQQHTSMSGELITYNKQQQEFVDIVPQGKSCVLIGAAGTGKTTATQGSMQALIQSGKVSVLQGSQHKHLIDGTPGILLISYTRRAVNNIRKVQSDDLKSNCITAHKLLEYAPQYYEIQDELTGEYKKTMRFEPSRNEFNPLPASIHTICVEEASMLSVELYEEINTALGHDVQWIFIGDINQLPPVFGSAILGYKMLELPVIELTEVYRQALESPIIRLAHRILSGKPIPVTEYADWHEEGKLTIHPWKKKLHPDTALLTLAAFFTKAIDSGSYNIDEDMILIPYNKSCGTIELNKHIANHLARKNGATTYEVMAGFNKHYFSIGDKVLYDKEDAEIEEIEYNTAYTGARVQPEGKFLDYWGHNHKPDTTHKNYAASGVDDVDALLAAVVSSEDRVTQASHKIVVRLLDSGRSLEITKAADVNNLLHSYALTVHKAQGSEWKKVFLCLHQSHATMLQRELLYTAVTRAREELYVICEPESFTKGIKSQKIKGNTLAEKAEWFKGKIS